jgi:hypothetical protein
MYCPRCSQQASDEVRFCSRCGLPLDAVAELVERGGLVEDVRVGTSEETGTLTPRQRGTRKGLLVLVAGLIFGVIATILTAIKEDFFVFLIVAAFLVTGGVMRMLYGMLLEDDSTRRKAAKKGKKEIKPARDKTRGELKRANARDAQLPPARAVPANLFANRRGDTSDIAAPPSVTESTTRLLEEDKPN